MNISHKRLYIIDCAVFFLHQILQNMNFKAVSQAYVYGMRNPVHRSPVSKAHREADAQSNACYVTQFSR